MFQARAVPLDHFKNYFHFMQINYSNLINVAVIGWKILNIGRLINSRLVELDKIRLLFPPFRRGKVPARQ
jgi:hypothetical protein